MFYILKDKNPIIADYEDWTIWMQSNHILRNVKQSQFNGGMVSTVFLGIDHNLSGVGEPVVFESLVFGGINDKELMRYSTWEEAVQGHEWIVKSNLRENLQLN